MEKQRALNVKEYDNFKCPKCGNEYFDTTTIVKLIPGMLVGAGSDKIPCPVPLLKCQKCGNVIDIEEEIDSINKPTKKSTLIL